MPASSHEYLYVGVKRHVLALDASTGDVVWEAELGGSGMATVYAVALHVAGGRVYASAAGEVHCLDAHTGALVWHNELKGYGLGFASLATAGGRDGAATAAAAIAAQQAADGAAAAGAG